MKDLFFLSSLRPEEKGWRTDLATFELSFSSGERRQIIDITDSLSIALGTAGFVAGLLTVQILHTTARLWHNENEPLLHADVLRVIEGLVPSGFSFGHDDLERRTVNVCPGECANGDSHLLAALFRESVSLQVWPDVKEEPAPKLGRWGRILLVELDGPRPERIISVMMSGYFKK